MMEKEREEKIKQLEKLNTLLKPKNFVNYKKELEIKAKYLNLLEIEDLETQIKKTITELQKIFLKCYQVKIKKITTKIECIKLMNEFRYYRFLPFSQEEIIGEIEEIEERIKEVEMLLLEKAHEQKIIDIFSKEKEVDYQILKNIFRVRVINLEDLYIKVIKENDKYYVQLFDENIFEEKIEIEEILTIKNKNLPLKLNKKVKIFN